MLAVRGIYDGTEFVALENFPREKRYKVIITFVEEVSEDDEIRSFSSQTNAFDFWNDEREDLYQDYLTAKQKTLSRIP